MNSSSARGNEAPALVRRSVAVRTIAPAWRVINGVWRFSKRKPLGAVSGAIILVLVFAALTPELIAPYDPAKNNYRALLQGASSTHWLGTDSLGRDVFSRILYGARNSLFIGILAAVGGTLHGAAWGVLTGYLGGRTDAIVQRFMDGIMAIPLLILAMVVVSALGSSTFNIILALAFVITPSANRVVRGTVLAVREEVYVDAARVIGASQWRIMMRHIVPNVFPPVLVLVSIALGGAILAEASLSFLGLGDPLSISWGKMLNQEGREYMEHMPGLAIYPGVAISLVVLSFNLLGDALRDVLDPRLRGR